MTRTGNAAINWATNQHFHPSRSWYRDCLMFVTDALDVPSRYGTAWLGYLNTNVRHTSWPPPGGVPVWWDGGAGHVALTIGDREATCWTNDFVVPGRISRVPIRSIGPGWGKTYHGWSEDINEVRIFTRPSIDISQVIHAALFGGTPAHGLLLKKALAAEVGQGAMGLGSSTFGGQFRVQYRRLQIKWYGKGDGIPGPVSLTRLCNLHGLDARP